MNAPALKEWSAALLDGRQTVLPRKRGIGESAGGGGPRVLAVPTVAHTPSGLPPEHRDLLLGPEAADSTDDECVLPRAA